MSELQRKTEQLLRSKGYLTGSVERRKRFPDKKQPKCIHCEHQPELDIAHDLWNCFDLIAIRPPNEIVFVQVTNAGNHANHRNKIIASAEAKICLLSGSKILLQSWRKIGNRWQPFDEWMTVDQFVFGLAETPLQFYEDHSRLKLLDRKAKLPALPPGSTLPLSPEISEETPF